MTVTKKEDGSTIIEFDDRCEWISFMLQSCETVEILRKFLNKRRENDRK